MTTMPHLLSQLRAALQLSDRSHQDLANKLGVARPTLSRKLNGKRPMTIQELEILAEYLGLQPTLRIKRRTQVAPLPPSATPYS